MVNGSRPLPGSPAAAAGPRRFGTFLGVFTPSVLTILGVIMYLRFGWVVAQAGLGGALLIVLICNAISLLTALSASTVATNRPLGAGGEYFLISRSLGLTIGGAIGIPLAMCRLLSVTLYCFGLAEALSMLWPAAWGAPPLPWLAAGLIVLTVAVAGRSADISLKLQVPLMGLVVLSLAALAIGVFAGPLRRPDLLAGAPAGARTVGFWVVLAVFFDAVTGFAAGIGMSGDLADPQRSIPRGTLAAVGVGAAVYLAVPLLLGVTGKVTWEQLASIEPGSPPLWTRIALLGGWLVFPGMWAAILSSAFGSALAGPRVLQALARDGLLPKLLARTSRTGQPTLAAWAGGAVALAAVLLGDLNDVAELVTIFFLTLYMSVNLVAAMERLVGDPSYRPTLNVHWAVSLLGAGANLAVMFLIRPTYGAVAIGLQFLLYLYLRRRALQGSWGDVWAGVWGSLARFALHRLTRRPRNVRSWRPNILVFADRVEDRAGVVRLASWFNQDRGVLTVCDVLEGSPRTAMDEARDREHALADFLRREGILAFGEVNVVEDFERGAPAIVQANGMGALRSNTIVFGWPRRPDRLAARLRMLRTLEDLGKAALIVRPNPPEGPRRFDRIDVWWRGRQRNGDLMLLLAHLLRLNPLWREAEITVRTIVLSEAARYDMERSLADLVRSVRIQARTEVTVKPPEQTVMEVMHGISRDADLVFLGLVPPEEGGEAEYADRLAEIAERLPTTILVRNSGPFEGKLLS